MAEAPTYSLAQIIALAKGTTNWFEYAKSGAQHGKNNQDDISTLQSAAFSGATPGWQAAIDLRWYVADTSSSTTTYTGVTKPSATGSDSLFAGYFIIFKPATNNTGASTLNVASSDGAVDIKKISSGAKAALAADDLDSDTYAELIFDGTDWIMLNAPVGGGTITALNSATENELVTVAATTTELDAEANLTFDGTDLTLGTGDIVFGTAGKGICLGVTSNTDANTLDDYEEGTWTPVIQDESSNNATMHSSFDEGIYTKIGRIVIVSGLVGTSSLGSASGNIRISGLPFAHTGGFAGAAGFVASTGGGLAITAGQGVSAKPINGTSYSNLYLWDSTAGSTNMQASEWSDDGSVAVGGAYLAA